MCKWGGSHSHVQTFKQSLIPIGNKSLSANQYNTMHNISVSRLY